MSESTVSESTVSESAVSESVHNESMHNEFIDILRESKTRVAVYLANGIKLEGVISSFDDVVIFLKGTVSQMIYRHSIATIVPSQATKLPVNGNK
ncbi:MAG: RNA chaperone Hfq [Pseudomonadota bacterium]